MGANPRLIHAEKVTQEGFLELTLPNRRVGMKVWRAREGMWVDSFQTFLTFLLLFSSRKKVRSSKKNYILHLSPLNVN